MSYRPRSRRKTVRVVAPSSDPVTIDNVREYLTRSSSTINKDGVTVKKNLIISNLRPVLRSRQANKVVYCSAYGQFRHLKYKGQGYFFVINVISSTNFYQRREPRRDEILLDIDVKPGIVVYFIQLLVRKDVVIQ